MKTLRVFAACAVAAALTSCAEAPDLLDQNSAGVTPTTASQILIVLDGKVFDSPLFGSEGHAYLTGIGTGLQAELSGVSTRVVRVDTMMFANPVPAAMQATRPSHTIRIWTQSDTRRNGFPIGATWQMDVSTVAISAVPATESKAAGTRFRMTPIYKARAEGDACLDSDSMAEKCGVAMGKLFGDTLRAAHVVQIDSGG